MTNNKYEVGQVYEGGYSGIEYHIKSLLPEGWAVTEHGNIGPAFSLTLKKPVYSREELLEAMSNGLGKDVPMATNANGGKQSYIPFRSDLFPPKAFLAVAAVLATGAVKYGEDNWRKISVKEHLNHALTHIMAYESGDTQDDHLEHATTRMMMAIEIKFTVVQK